MNKRAEEIIKTGREFIWSADGKFLEGMPDYQTDQELKKPQPPLYKEPMGGKITELPVNYQTLPLKQDILEILYKRKSSRVYTKEAMSLQELSYLLWATQGVKEIRGKNYATIRTVACGGARHQFECYMAIKNVEGLENGYYHYMPDRHAVELIAEVDEENMFSEVENALWGQRWACRAQVVFFYSIIPYRAEWRYGVEAHRVALIDAGHITQNLYIACASAQLGTCAIAAVETELANQMFHLDGKEEFIFYAATAGKISEENQKEEDAFYAFLKESEEE